MPRRLVSSGSAFEEKIGYSRAVVDGEWIFVSGTTGFDYATMTIADDLVGQAEQCLKNIAAALAQAGASLDDVVRVTYLLPDGAGFESCWPVLRKHFGAIRPAATMISAGLADPRMKIEIEVTARRRHAAAIERRAGSAPGRSRSVACGDIVWTVATASDRSKPFAIQAAESLDRLAALLEEAGSARTRLLSLQVLLADMADYAAFDALWLAWIGADPQHWPQRACFQAALAPGLRVELVATAATQARATP